MPDLNFIELLVASRREKRAMRLDLSQATTILLGPNRTGKSSLIKSLYSAFGADSAVNSPEWRDSAPSVLVRFAYRGRIHSALRHAGRTSLLDNKGRLLISNQDGMRHYSQGLANFLTINLRLLDRGGDLVAPFPAHIFLPFYIDQDAGWTSVWRSFRDLKSLPNQPERKLIEYYTGIRSDEYYRIQAELDQLKIKSTELNVERRSIVSTGEVLATDFPAPVLPIELAEFENEIRTLTELVSTQRQDEDARLRQLIALQNELAVTSTQLTAARRIYKELRQDFHFATSSAGPQVQCPTCNAVYENDFATRFEIANDAERCQELILELNQEQTRIRGQIEEARPAHAAARRRYEVTRDLLQKQHNAVSLSEVLTSQARSMVQSVLRQTLDRVDTQIAANAVARSKLEAQRSRELDGKRSKEIAKFLNDEFRRIASDLGVAVSTPLRGVMHSVQSTGSDHPREILAYRLALIRTTTKYGRTLRAPVVIDSPNQQAQDPENLAKIMQCIIKELHGFTPLVLATESLFGTPPPEGAKLIKLTGRSALEADLFAEVWTEIDSAIKSTLSSA